MLEKDISYYQQQNEQAMGKANKMLNIGLGASAISICYIAAHYVFPELHFHGHDISTLADSGVLHYVKNINFSKEFFDGLAYDVTRTEFLGPIVGMKMLVNDAYKQIKN